MTTYIVTSNDKVVKLTIICSQCVMTRLCLVYKTVNTRWQIVTVSDCNGFQILKLCATEAFACYFLVLVNIFIFKVLKVFHFADAFTETAESITCPIKVASCLWYVFIVTYNNCKMIQIIMNAWYIWFYRGCIMVTIPKQYLRDC